MVEVRSVPRLAACCVGLLAATPVAAQESGAPVAVTAFVHVAVIPMDRERVLQDQTVLVRGNRIVALGPAKQVKVPAGAREIDGRGKFLMPGLADMHTHHGDSASLFLYLANGVTTLRGGISEAVRTGCRLIPPRIYYWTGWQDCRPENVQPLAQCLAKKKAVGYDFVKTTPETPAQIDSLAAAAKTAGFYLGGHIIRGGPEVLEQALRVRYRSIEHLTGYLDYVVGYPLPWPFSRKFQADSATLDTMAWMQPGYRLDAKRLRDIALTTKRAGTWNAPTLSVQTRSPSDPPIERSSPEVRGMWRRAELDLQIVKALHDAGAGLLLSTDAGPAFVARELELYVQAGLTPYQALKTGTRDIALYLGTQDSAGTVAVGKWADLVLLDGNPLKDICNMIGPAGVMADGRWLSRTAIEARLDSMDVEKSALRPKSVRCP